MIANYVATWLVLMSWKNFIDIMQGLQNMQNVCKMDVTASRLPQYSQTVDSSVDNSKNIN